MDYDADLQGIANLLRKNIEVRNRSMLKRVYRDCFVGSVAVDFILSQCLAETREDAVIICRKMEERGLIKPVTTSKFKDANQYCRFADDDPPSSVLATSSAGNGEGTFFGEGGCKWSFAPHTAHNSYVLDVNLAEEIERAVAGASVESRLRAISKLRARVKEEAAPGAPDWIPTQSIAGKDGPMNIYSRKRPRGDFHNVKITGTVGESSKEFIKSVINFESRKDWEASFEDGVVVEVIDVAEKNGIFSDEGADDGGRASPVTRVTMELSESPKPIPNLARSTDDVLTYLSSVDLTGVPPGMSVAFLNDPERQHMLSHLRKQIMESKPQQCMICDHQFANQGEVRFCPCCATACCSNCMSKKVFEIASRQVVVICVHCYRMSSRIWQPPQNVTDSSQISEEMRGKWWRPEGIADFDPSTGTMRGSDTGKVASGDGDGSDEEDEVEGDDDVSNVVPGYKLTHDAAGNEQLEYEELSTEELPDGGRDTRGLSEPPPPPPETPPGRDTSGSSSMVSSTASPTKGHADAVATPTILPKTAKCKKCGETISREIEAIEKHMEECMSNQLRGADINAADGEMRARAAGTSVVAGSWWSTPKHLAGISRQPELDKCSARIIYRTARGKGGTRPREACCFQDFFIDPVDGACYVYEISIRHCDVRGIPGHITEDVLLSMHVATPIKGVPNACSVRVIYQVDERARSPKWVRSLKSTDDAFKADLVRVFKACGRLKHILPKPDIAEDGDGVEGADTDAEPEDPNHPRLEHFDLLAVLGRGGFGKVMQVRHIETGGVYAMKILKKSELRRRRQVERTKTERTILAAVQHPFIVQLYYAFQTPSKLYMVMDFVQGGDFFTLMRKFKRMPEDWVRVYIAEIAMALEHLHKMDIVYRDLKPENILLCEDGHLKITDFGLSRNFEMRPPNPEDVVDDDAVTRSFCGTEQYMSPEMLLQQGHNWRMDWWCLGLLMHEMISTRHPFNGPSHYDTLRNMVTKQPVIDSRLSPLAVAVVKGLLVKAPKARLCCHTGVEELKALPFFNGLDWHALFNRRIRAPYIPELSNKEDVSSFETTFTKEAAVDSIAETPRSMKNGGKSGGGILGFFGFKSGSQSAAKAGAESAPFDGFEFGREDEMSPKDESVILHPNTEDV